MSRLFALAPLISVIPIAASLVNQPVLMLGLGVAWAAYLGLLMVVPDAVRPSLLAQAPLMVTFSALAVLNARRSFRADSGDAADDMENEYLRCRSRHAQLKEEVAQTEKEEARSLQIYGVAKSLAEALSWKDMAPRLASGIQKVFNAYEFLLYAFTEDGNWTLLHRRGAWTQDLPIHGHMPSEARFVLPPETSEVVPVLCVPIYAMTAAGSQMNGILFLKTNAPEKEYEELGAVGREFGEQLGMTLNKALLFSQMEMHSLFDGLTGVLRRQPFMDRLAEEMKKAKAFKTPFSVAMVDIDHFKSVNDSHGHAAGDAVLKRMAEMLKESIYETDLVGRYGGEEFIILFPKAQADGVRRKVEALRQKIERETIVCGFERLKISVSVGLAHYPHHGLAADQLIAQADRALYRAKETGRNRVMEP
jgi:diguanylate cyclase (GGDEF)-like protein